MKKLLKYFTFLLLVSCNQKIKENIDSSEKEVNKKIETEVIQEQYIENDTLLSKMESDLNELVKNPKFTIEKELVNNRHVENIIDTIKTFNFDKINIKSYKAVSEEWIFEAKILNSGFEFAKSIKIGIDKKSFEKILNTKLNSEIVKVGNLEQTSVFIFKFEKDSLKEIDYEGYVD
ncbi:hypothetical protein BD847_0352 [Flavobacterium cutihirudinis]|uniref:Uncharacterized protein n=1 Tax=Flavobacterium cutihirudinis TaxID=1265740 RepID=A0A3D9FZR7_9FLAO|nr:hypothetical protein [Flavobacterium cutihirudinis]RED26434.1 hypothetical protein BD847_0352 [Flavobacterium cutihirudinis]